MAGWALIMLNSFIMLSAIYFIGHLNLVLLDQEYRAFQLAMYTVQSQQPQSLSCAAVQVVGTLLPYKHCSQSSWGYLSLIDGRQKYFQDLSISANRLAQADLSYAQLGQERKAFKPFFTQLQRDLKAGKTLVVLADEGSSSSLTQMQDRLDRSQHTWSGVLDEALQSFKEYLPHIQKTDGVWRSVDDAHWLEAWRALSPGNELLPHP